MLIVGRFKQLVSFFVDDGKWLVLGHYRVCEVCIAIFGVIKNQKVCKHSASLGWIGKEQLDYTAFGLFVVKYLCSRG